MSKKAETPVKAPTTIEGGISDGLKRGWNGEPLSGTKTTGASNGLVGAVVAAPGAIADAAGKGVSETKDLFSKPATDPNKAKGFFDELDPFKIIGGLLGLGAAYLCGSFIGDGWISTIVTICLAMPMMMICSDKGGDWLRGAFGYGKPASKSGDSPSPEAPALSTPKLSNRLDTSKNTSASPAAPENGVLNVAPAGPAPSIEEMRAGFAKSNVSYSPTSSAPQPSVIPEGAKPLLELTNADLVSLFDASHHYIKFAPDSSNLGKLKPVSVADTEATNTMLSVDKIKTIEAATPGSVGISVYTNNANGIAIVGLPPRAATNNQR